MTDTTALDTQRADEARKKLLRDILEIKKMSNKMIENTETAIHKAPVMLGLGVAALIGVAVLASRRPKPSFAFPGFRRERSFFAEAAPGRRGPRGMRYSPAMVFNSSTVSHWVLLSLA